jgi:hypothetical protein
MIKKELTRKDLVEFFEKKVEFVASNFLKSFCKCLADEFADNDLSYCTERKDFVYTGVELPKIKVK